MWPNGALARLTTKRFSCDDWRTAARARPSHRGREPGAGRPNVPSARPGRPGQTNRRHAVDPCIRLYGPDWRHQAGWWLSTPWSIHPRPTDRTVRVRQFRPTGGTGRLLLGPQGQDPALPDSPDTDPGRHFCGYRAAGGTHRRPSPGRRSGVCVRETADAWVAPLPRFGRLARAGEFVSPTPANEPRATAHLLGAIRPSGSNTARPPTSVSTLCVPGSLSGDTVKMSCDSTARSASNPGSNRPFSPSWNSA